MDEALGHPGRPLPASPYAAGQRRERVWTFERLSFQAAHGSLTLGSQHTLDLHAATPLAFRNIEGPGVIGEHLVVPVRINSRTVKVRIQGRAETVNNDPYLTEQPAWVRFIDVDFVTVVATLIGLFLSASTYLLARNVGGRHH